MCVLIETLRLQKNKFFLTFDCLHVAFVCFHSSFLTFSFQKQVAKEVPSKPVDILSEAAMRNAYYTCHNVQVKMQYIGYDCLTFVEYVDGTLWSLITD